MPKFFRSAALAALVAAGTFTLAAPAQARDRWDRGGGDDAAIAIGAGIVGLAIGAAIADRDDDRYYDRDTYRHRRYVRVHGYPDYYYYYDGYPNRYYRDRYYDRHYGSYRPRSGRYYYRENSRYGHRYSRNRWEREHDRYERRNRDGYRREYRRDWRY